MKSIGTPEVDEGKRIDSINRHIDHMIEEIDQIIKQLPPEPTQEWDKLNRLFLSMLNN